MSLIQALAVAPPSLELQGVEGLEMGVDRAEAALVDQKLQALRRWNLKVEVTLGADLVVLLDVLLPDGVAAGRALDPEIARNFTLLRKRIRLNPLFTADSSRGRGTRRGSCCEGANHSKFVPPGHVTGHRTHPTAPIERQPLLKRATLQPNRQRIVNPSIPRSAALSLA